MRGPGPDPGWSAARPVNVVVSGSYGFRNLGDEAVLTALLAELHRQLPHLRVIVVSGDPDDTRDRHGTEAIPWRDVGAIRRSLAEADLAVLGGGGLFHDYWGFDPTQLLLSSYSGMVYSSSFGLLALTAGVPLAIWAVGLGPLTNPAARDVTRLLLDKAAWVSLRDETSLALARELGVERADLYLVADPVLGMALPPAQPAVRAAKLCVCLREWRETDVDWLSRLADVLRIHGARTGCVIQCLPFQTLAAPGADDRVIAQQLARLVGPTVRVECLPEQSLARALDAIASSRAVLTMRFHGLLLACRLGIPAVGLAYDQKLTALGRALGVEHRVLAIDAPREALQAALEEAWSGPALEPDLAATKLSSLQARPRSPLRWSDVLAARRMEAPALLEAASAHALALAAAEGRAAAAADAALAARAAAAADRARLNAVLSSRSYRLARLVVRVAAPLRERRVSSSSPEPALVRSRPAAHRGRRVPIVTPAFYDDTGKRPYWGGAERYLVELVRLLREQGFEPEIYQRGGQDWTLPGPHGTQVQALACEAEPGALSRAFHSRVAEGLFTIYFAFYLASPECHGGSIGVSHGVYWDDPARETLPELGPLEREAVAATAALSRLVSVDTNTISWLSGLQGELSGRLRYIPNFVDTAVFRPTPGRRVGRNLRLLYPRRLYGPRGYWLMAEIVPALLRDHPHLHVRFAGQADPAEADHVRGLVRAHPGRVSWEAIEPMQMPAEYGAADVTVIPSVHSEGTSLSCLEALASGNTVIATTVGGLPNLVLSEYNGLLTAPQADALHEAIDRVLGDARLRHRLARRGRTVATTFSLGAWRERWSRVLREVSA